MSGLLIRNSFLLAMAETDYGVLGSAIANSDAIKIVSMEVNPITGTRVERSLIKGFLGADRQPLTNEHVAVTITFEWGGSGVAATAPRFSPLLLASGTANETAFGEAFNVGLGKATDLNELFQTIRTLVSEETKRTVADVIHRDFRAGDIRHSCADTTRVEAVLGFAGEHTVMDGLRETVAWFLTR